MEKDIQREDILLLGNCGFERLSSQLRSDYNVTVAGIHDVHLIDELQPILVYVDLFDWSIMTPMYTMAVVGKKYQLPIVHLNNVVASLQGRTVWYRGIRVPSGGSFGVWQRNPIVEEQIKELRSVVSDCRVIDIQALWARHGIILDDVQYGLGHGEATLEHGVEKPAKIESNAIRAIVSSRASIKCIVVDLDDTLIFGNITADDFEERNPAYTTSLPHEQGWWKLQRGLHEALRVAKSRGIVLALASRNEPAVVRDRFVRRSDVQQNPASIAIEHLALDIHDFQILEVGHHNKSLSCRRIAQTLGIGLDAISFVDNSLFEQEEVAHSLPMVHVLRGGVHTFREEILCGLRFQPWFVEFDPQQRARSYRARAVVASQPQAGIHSFLCGLSIRLQIRKAETVERGRVLSLLQRSNQLVLTKEREFPKLNFEVWVAHMQDRMADHGLISAGIFVLEHDCWGPA